jgi:hypothetical protein
LPGDGGTGADGEHRGQRRHDQEQSDACDDEVLVGDVPAGRRPSPVPNRMIRAVADVRLVRAMASPVVAAAMPSVSSVLAFTSVPAAEPKGVRWLTKKVARMTSAASRNRTPGPQRGQSLPEELGVAAEGKRLRHNPRDQRH